MKLIPADTKICPSCGKTFTCTGDADCWCESVRINKKELLILMNKYQDCICADCLGQYAEGDDVSGAGIDEKVKQNLF